LQATRRQGARELASGLLAIREGKRHRSDDTPAVAPITHRVVASVRRFTLVDERSA
jgi:hypothetical protein